MSDYKRGTCRWCETRGHVFKDNLLCDDCDGDVVNCRICNQDQHRDDPCRHVFQDEDFSWCGAGVEYASDSVRASFLLLVQKMPDDFAAALSTAIRSGRFYTWLIAPMIGGGGLLELNGMPDRDGGFSVFWWGQQLIKIGESDAAKATRDGYCWLASLYKADTPKANEITLKMLEDYDAGRRALAEEEGK